MSSLILRVGSLEFTPTSWSFEESVWKYCPELRFTLRSALPSDVFTFGDSDVSWVVISCVGSGDDKYDYVCYPKSFWDQCNVVSDCVNGDYTLPELCSVLGLPFIMVIVVVAFRASAGFCHVFVVLSCLMP